MLLSLLLMLPPALQAQTAPPAPAAPQAPADPQAEPTPPKGKVLFSRGADTEAPQNSDAAPQTSAPAAPISSSKPDATTVEPGPPDSFPATPVTDVERAALRITAYDLDLHLIPAEAREEVHASLTVRNAGTTPLTRLPLQLSSTLRWQSVSTAGAALAFTQSPIATDTDHTGYAQEAILTPAAPLAPGASLTLSVIYSGTIRQSAARLELLGVDATRAVQTDWDQIAPATDDASTALRGFGDVLWYPVAAPIALLGDGNKLFEIIARERLDESAASIRLHLTVVYAGEPPNGVIFLGELRPLTKVADEDDQLIATTQGVATADFAARLLGFRAASLFLTAQQPLPSDRGLVTVTAHAEVIPPYEDAVRSLEPLFSAWFGAAPLEPLLLLDHAGEPFSDGPFIAAHLAADAEPGGIADAIVGPSTASWFHSVHPWIADGLAGFISVLWTERKSGRDDALAQLTKLTTGLALVEPDLSQAGAVAGQPLVQASSPVYTQGKATAVWWQLREILGEDTLRQALTAYRVTCQANPGFDADPKAMQQVLERISGKPLGWFFDDWVYRDRGLPDLTVGDVNPRPLPFKGGRSGGYLVAVEVKNDGDAVADVPVTVRSERLTATERLRIPAHGLASTRILFEDIPVNVQVNDGSTPEVRTTVHTKDVQVVTR